jgi:predicted house-cleaning noncanonical NTP pyrophosphatase (MazG superfamily)
MAWETRGNKKYYYRKKRIGNYVHSIYVGDEITGKILAMDDEYKRLLGEKPNDKLHECIEREKELNKMADQIELVVNSIFLISGYHCHKGQWRKPHERNNQ